MQPKVSMIIPVYNNEQYVRQCVESILGQTLGDLEVVCVNDGSTDSSKDILHEYEKIDDRVIVIDKENSGYGANLNIGFKRATGEYIGILESDDFAEPDMIERLYGMASKNDLEVARSNFSLYWSTPEEKDVFLELFGEWECDRVIDPSIRDNQHCFYVQPAIWSAIYKKDFLTKNKLSLLETPGAAYQDTAFNFKVWACASRVMFDNKPLVHYRQDNESSSINNPGKIYCICDEYDEIRRWLREEHPKMEDFLIPVANKMMFDAYTWNCKRVTPDHRLEFATFMSEEFAKARDSKTLDKTLFSDIQWSECELVINDPKAFCMHIEEADEDVSVTYLLKKKSQTFLYYLNNYGVKGAFELAKRKLAN